MLPLNSPTRPPLTQLQWKGADSAPTLHDSQLHLWRLDLTRGNAQGDENDLALLCPRQRQRMQRLLQPQHRRRYLRAQASCRRILATYVDLAPENLRFRHGSTGKPALQLRGTPPEFNLTTTGDLALIAIGRTDPIGIDCELECDHRNLLGIARRVFDETVVEDLAVLTGSARRRLFHLHWTALEARVKADGRGLARHLDADPPGLKLAHALADELDGQAAVLAVARRRLPPPAHWLALELRGWN